MRLWKRWSRTYADEDVPIHFPEEHVCPVLQQPPPQQVWDELQQ